jgi:hypothetical protein
VLLYPRAALARFIDGQSSRARCVWQQLQRIRPELITAGGRTYGGGIVKLEPKELAGIPSPGLAGLR